MLKKKKNKKHLYPFADVDILCTSEGTTHTIAKSNLVASSPATLAATYPPTA